MPDNVLIDTDILIDVSRGVVLAVDFLDRLEQEANVAMSQVSQMSFSSDAAQPHNSHKCNVDRPIGTFLEKAEEEVNMDHHPCADGVALFSGAALPHLGFAVAPF